MTLAQAGMPVLLKRDATDGLAVTDRRLAFLFARIRIRGGGGFGARNGGALARRRAGLNSRVSTNDLPQARQASWQFHFASLRRDRRATQKQAGRRRCRRMEFSR